MKYFGITLIYFCVFFMRELLKAKGFEEVSRESTRVTALKEGMSQEENINKDVKGGG